MSRSKLLGASLVALLAGTAAAAAGDIPSYTPPPSPSPVYSPTPAYSWSGAYVGLLGGYNWGHASIDSGPNPSAKGWNGSLYTGYNFMLSNNFLMGIEGDIGLGGPKGSLPGYSFKSPWSGSVRARAGVAVGRFLMYGTGGLAFGDIKASGGGASDSQVKVGWTAGAGIETALTNNVTARLEYRYTDYGTASLSTNPSSTVDLHSNALMVGLGVKF